MEKRTTLDKATFAGGCFWCTEAVFTRLKGVESVLPGYAGGDMENPSYEAVSAGQSGHAEAIQLAFDSSVIPYERLLDVFFATHNPTTLNRQGNDIGEQYRSVIFYHSDAQRKIAEATKARLEQEKTFKSKIVTEIVPFTNFYQAEEYHRDYYAKNPDKAYCQAIISPKVAKLRQKFSKYLKENSLSIPIRKV